MDVRSCRDAGTIAERHTCVIELLDLYSCALSRARPERLRFSLDFYLHGWPVLT